jgi:hypothetical protein
MAFFDFCASQAYSFFTTSSLTMQGLQQVAVGLQLLHRFSFLAFVCI